MPVPWRATLGEKAYFGMDRERYVCGRESKEKLTPDPNIKGVNSKYQLGLMYVPPTRLLSCSTVLDFCVDASKDHGGHFTKQVFWADTSLSPARSSEGAAPPTAP